MASQRLTDDLARAEAAVLFAQQVRKTHRRRKRRLPTQRRQDIDEAVKRVREAMKPLRSEIGRFPYGPQGAEADMDRDRIRAASAALQSERRKLWKMSKATKGEAQE